MKKISLWGTPQQFWTIGKYQYPFYRNILENICKKQLKQDSIILDAGCGANISSISKQPETVTVICLDIKQENLKTSHRLSQKKGYTNYNYIRASVTATPFKNEIFDLIVSTDVIEHVQENRQVINEAYRTCKNGGAFIGTTSNLHNPIFLMDSYLPKQFMSKLEHKYSGTNHYERHTRLSLKTLTKLFWDTGFHAIYIKLLGFPLFKAWEYRDNNKKVPIYGYLWIIFNKITSFGVLRHLKEAIVFCATKDTHFLDEKMFSFRKSDFMVAHTYS